MDIVYIAAGKMIISKVISWIIKWLPKYIAKRFIPEKSIVENIEIDLRSINAVVFDLSGSLPGIRMYFRITNKNPIPVAIDRILLDVWLSGQPFVKDNILHRFELAPGMTAENVMFYSQLSDIQLSNLKSCTNLNRQEDGTIKMWINGIDVYGMSGLGGFHVNTWTGSQLRLFDFPVSIKPFK